MAALAPGTRLGPYEILDAIGAGGMGEVYRGRDTRLDRIVAIKVLASNLAADPQSRDRFEREAKAISSLNHPNICALYDVGRERPIGGDGPPVDESPVDFLVMEYLEGETLTARLARGASRASRSAALSHSEKTSDETVAVGPSAPKAVPPMTVDEALGVVVQIAGALDRAHRQGIVHRDLKPGNVMLTKGGVKLLDFGLARLTRAGAGSEGGIGHGMVSLADLSMPTVTSPLTMKGAILGTLQYMAPEQLEGKEVDARADIFAFGGVLYEMLTGRRPFDGKSQASLIGAILDHTPPPVTTFQPVSPPLLDEIVARCLAKDPDDRWQTSRDLKHQLEWVSTHLVDDGVPIAGEAQTVPRSSAAARVLRVGVAVLGGAMIAAAIVAWALWPKPPAPQFVTRFVMELPQGQVFTRAGRHVVALSPDGTRLVYVANQQLYVRAMNELTATPLPGTASDPAEPVFSPDGQWVAFWSANELRKVPISGGTPVTLAGAELPWGMSWQGDRILLGQGSPRGVIEVPANGGASRVLVTVDDKKSEWVQSPQLVSGGRAVLFGLRTGLGAWDDGAIVVQDIATGQRTVLVNGGTDARVLPTGHLVYVREATLFALPFDESRLAVTGGPVPIQPGIRLGSTAVTGTAQWAWSASGSLLFVPGDAVSNDRALVWMDRQGHEERATAPVKGYATLQSGLRLSPDGTRAALTVEVGGGRAPATPSTGVTGQGAVTGSDIWIWGIARGTLTRLSFTSQASSPLWTPNGRRVCYRNVNDVLCQEADNSGQAQKLATVDGLTTLKSFSPDGSRFLSVTTGGTANDIVMTTIGPPAESRPLIQTPSSESGAAISPDGRWLAYHSIESRSSEIYVRPFPSVEQGIWQVSSEGGSEPRWAHSGRELIFMSGGGGGTTQRLIWSTPIQSGASFVAGKPSVIAKLPPTSSGAYDVASDGRILYHIDSVAGAATASSQLVVVQHWFDELKARVPTARRPNQ